MKQIIRISPSTRDQMRFEARQRAMAEHKKKSAINISPGLKKALSKVKKTCGRC